MIIQTVSMVDPTTMVATKRTPTIMPRMTFSQLPIVKKSPARTIAEQWGSDNAERITNTVDRASRKARYSRMPNLDRIRRIVRDLDGWDDATQVWTDKQICTNPSALRSEHIWEPSGERIGWSIKRIDPQTKAESTHIGTVSDLYRSIAKRLGRVLFKHRGCLRFRTRSGKIGTKFLNHPEQYMNAFPETVQALVADAIVQISRKGRFSFPYTLANYDREQNKGSGYWDVPVRIAMLRPEYWSDRDTENGLRRISKATYDAMRNGVTPEKIEPNTQYEYRITIRRWGDTVRDGDDSGITLADIAKAIPEPSFDSRPYSDKSILDTLTNDEQLFVRLTLSGCTQETIRRHLQIDQSTVSYRWLMIRAKIARKLQERTTLEERTAKYAKRNAARTTKTKAVA